VADLFWQWLRGETTNSPLDRMTAYPAARWILRARAKVAFGAFLAIAIAGNE
jgi:hypothetical protein